MRILISNDDGIHAPGLHALTKVMAQVGEVTVVAPHTQRSASSHGISLYRPLYADKVDLGIQRVTAYSFTGTPVDCVKWGIVQFGQERPFDLMVSGMNDGPNLATDVLYSGTVAAAGEAALQGVPAIAFSLLGPTPFPYEAAAKKALEFVDTMLTELTLPSDTFLSVNMPNTSLQKARWVVTELGARTFLDKFLTFVDDDGRTYYRYDGEELQELTEGITDVETVAQGDISVTPLRYRFTNFDFLESLRTHISSNTSR